MQEAGSPFTPKESRLRMEPPLTSRQRMLAAYTGSPSDCVPVAPEFWYYLPARVLGISMIELELEVPHWQALQQTFRRYGCEGWGIAMPGDPCPAGRRSQRQVWLEDGRLEEINELTIAGQALRSRRILDRQEPSWLVERYIKDFERDWPLYAQVAFTPPDELDWAPVRQALEAVGEDFLLEVYIGEGFIDFAGGQREGGFEQVIADLADRPAEMRALQERYIAYMAEKTRATFRNTAARSVFVGCTWSNLSLLSPAIWRKWDQPVLAAITAAAHESGGFIHHHFHGRCMKVLPDLAALGMDCICPFERPPGGDVTDLPAFAKALDGRTAFNGNVQTVETLIRGTPADVRREVLEILAAFEGSDRVIIGTGDQVGAETPEDNIWAMIETARAYGKK
jgi:uroporphyrinogen decarboxylase